MGDACILTPLPFMLSFCTLSELQQLSQVSRDVSSICEPEWRLRTIASFGELRFATRHWRRCFLLRSQFQRKAVKHVTARVYLMNNRGETRFFTIEKGTPLMCSRERAVVYNRCKRMFDLSLRINRSIQEISEIIGMVSVDEARGLLNEHIGLMASVAALRSSLNFESELFQIFPAPVLLDTNSLLRVTHKFHHKEDVDFLQSSIMMMQIWASIDGVIYRPLAPPTTIQETPDNIDEMTTYASYKLHELSGMTISIDDNTLRYRLQRDELCVNALVSNTYLLYLFNPLQYRPLDWTFDALLQVGDAKYVLPVQREGVFLNTTSYALRVFLSYGKIPATDAQDNLSAVTSSVATESVGGRARGSDDSEPLEIPYDGQREIFAFHLSATNRMSKKSYVIASNATCLSLLPSESSIKRRLRRLSLASSSTLSDDEEDDKDTSFVTKALPLERHVHLSFDAMICYCFASSCQLQYVEFAIGFEPLMHLLGVIDFLSDVMGS
ncbi:uncharacterized protein PHALS_07109 [Plasmopara halstedii]|uniref:Uncharacterized protein n=1 Tax=Plasmopara halstedii TaxID=4781 RepID=A0A0P1B3N6_PLAHL|nr:uncharacterized protein PHALS_07109 [Plasmopara halstedii]CEG49341.1 hypothetical protein PHALS_07109 [Plasmopara halstedii]|eukprot:XP_024585710.1 hypothetical protein PHALS_07109 [Plasmopara halstedii]